MEDNKDIFSNAEDEIIIQEKIDGANFRFYITNEGQVIFGSRTQELEDTKKNFTRCIDFIKEKLLGFDLTKFKGYIFYGECCVKHTINYDWNKIPPFLGFDIYDTATDTFLDYDIVNEIYKELLIDTVPLVSICKAKDIKEINDDLVPISKYALCKAEGLVFKNYNKQIFAKYVRAEFKEENNALFGNKKRETDNTNNEEFVFKYVTNARIEKLIFKKIDDGKYLDMALMGELIKDTYLDIVEENYLEIMTGNWTLDFKNIRRSITPRVRAVLNTVITNNNLR